MEESSLTKAARSIKSDLAIFLLIFLSVSIGSYLVYKITKKPEPPPQNLAYKNNVVPGKTTRSQVESILGDPEKKEANNKTQNYTYPTENKYRQDSVEFTNDIVTLVK